MAAWFNVCFLFICKRSYIGFILHLHGFKFITRLVQCPFSWKRKTTATMDIREDRRLFIAARKKETRLYYITLFQYNIDKIGGNSQRHHQRGSNRPAKLFQESILKPMQPGLTKNNKILRALFPSFSVS